MRREGQLRNGITKRKPAVHRCLRRQSPRQRRGRARAPGLAPHAAGTRTGGGGAGGAGAGPKAARAKAATQTSGTVVVVLSLHARLSQFELSSGASLLGGGCPVSALSPGSLKLRQELNSSWLVSDALRQGGGFWTLVSASRAPWTRCLRPPLGPANPCVCNG